MSVKPKDDSIILRYDSNGNLTSRIGNKELNDIEDLKEEDARRRHNTKKAPITEEQRWTERKRIINNFERKVLESLNDNEFSFMIFTPSMGYSAFKNFKNINELVKVNISREELLNSANLITIDSMKFFRVALVIHKGKAVASGCFSVTE